MILEKIIDMLKEQEVLDNTEITEDTTFEELDLDSLSIVDLTMSCEFGGVSTIDSSWVSPAEGAGSA